MRYLPFNDPLHVLYAGRVLRPSSALLRIMHMAQGMNADTLGVEDSFVSPQWDAERKAVYGQTFRPLRETAIRLHFFHFGKTTAGDEALPFLQPGDYLGYCVVRPGPRGSVLEAFIRPCLAKSARRHYFDRCCYERRVHFGDNPAFSLSVRGFPFHEQDGWCLSCAEVAILSVVESLADRYGGKMPGIADLMKVARAAVGISSDTRSLGLHLPDVVRCLKEFGVCATAWHYQVNEVWPLPPENVIYPYLESGLPVIVSVPTAVGARHALVIIGHTFGQDFWWANAGQAYYREPPEQEGIPWVPGQIMALPSAIWLRDYIVNDDNFGPYLTIPKEFMRASASAQPHEPDHLGIVTVLPTGVRLGGETVDRIARECLTEQVRKISQALNEPTETSPKPLLTEVGEEWFYKLAACVFRGQPLPPEERVIFRTLLMEGPEYRSKLCNEGGDETSRALISQMKLPGYVWITEISLPNLFSLQRKKLGELVFDATEPGERDTLFVWLMTTLCGSVFVVRPEVGIPPDKPITLGVCRDIILR